MYMKKALSLLLIFVSSLCSAQITADWMREVSTRKLAYELNMTVHGTSQYDCWVQRGELITFETEKTAEGLQQLVIEMANFQTNLGSIVQSTLMDGVALPQGVDFDDWERAHSALQSNESYLVAFIMLFRYDGRPFLAILQADHSAYYIAIGPQR